MKRLLLFLSLALACHPVQAQPTFPSYFSTSDLALTSPGALKYGLYGFDNPALLSTLRQGDFQFSWTDAGKWNDFNRWGAFFSAPHAAFDVVKTKTELGSLTDYRFALGMGDLSNAVGIAYTFSGGDKGAFQRANSFTLGTLKRVDPHISLGLVGTVTTTGGSSEAVADLGIRPFANEWCTLFADYAIQNGQVMRDAGWSYGAAIEPVPGVRMTGRYFSHHGFSLGFAWSLGNAGVSAQSSWDKESRHAFNTYSVRLGGFDRTILQKLMRRSSYVTLDMLGGMKYQRFMFFDNSKTLAGTLEAIAAAKDDETVAGIAINTSGMETNQEMLWELREALVDFKTSGKHVVVFVDRPAMEEFAFASVADRIVMDPTGMLAFPGYAMSRTFFKGTLEKLGLGYDEWRFFKYKSANENMSREKYSDADREQRQKYIDDLYGVWRSTVSASRRMPAEQVDRVVNDTVLMLAPEALALGLVDTLGRWEAVVDMVQKLEGREMSQKPIHDLAAFNEPYDNHWGEPPRIAVIYALGVCAMDEGIKARTLVHDVEAAGSDPRVKAIVLRVDSPGGDGTASDYIAEAMKKAKKNKPVIVSQGLYAASGGYWLSMYADTIVAAPSTITGSIGVIGGWLYNNGLKEKLGVSTDVVKVGDHADILSGMTVPFVGVSLPDRNLTDVERKKIELGIKEWYRLFVSKVAEGRKTTPEKIEPFAQGHFYSGLEGKRIGLVDLIGGLQTAVQVAKARAGIAPTENATVVEYPAPRLFDFSFLTPKIVGFEHQVVLEPAINYMKFRLEHNGEPMPMLPLEDLTGQIPTE